MFRKKAEKRKDVIKMAKELNLQDVFLNQARKEKIPVTIYITNGFQQSVLLKMFCNFLRTLPHPSPASDTDGKQNLIYKHAISTITPLRAVSILDAFDRTDSEDVKE